MNKNVKQKWLKALRSGEYEQGRGNLRNNIDEFCCLGVLCDLYRKENNKRWCKRKFMGREDFLPEKVMEWAGMESENPFITDIECKNDENNDNLAEANDDEFTFNEIADIIEEQL